MDNSQHGNYFLKCLICVLMCCSIISSIPLSSVGPVSHATKNNHQLSVRIAEHLRCEALKQKELMSSELCLYPVEDHETAVI